MGGSADRERAAALDRTVTDLRAKLDAREKEFADARDRLAVCQTQSGACTTDVGLCRATNAQLRRQIWLGPALLALPRLMQSAPQRGWMWLALDDPVKGKRGWGRSTVIPGGVTLLPLAAVSADITQGLQVRMTNFVLAEGSFALEAGSVSKRTKPAPVAAPGGGGVDGTVSSVVSGESVSYETVATGYVGVRTDGALVVQPEPQAWVPNFAGGNMVLWTWPAGAVRGTDLPALTVVLAGDALRVEQRENPTQGTLLEWNAER